MSRETTVEELLGFIDRLAAHEPTARCEVGEGPLAPLAEALNRLADQLETSREPTGEQFFIRALVEQAPSIMLACDVTGQIRFINYTVPGMTRADLEGTSLYDLIRPEELEDARGYIQRVIENGESVGYESRSSVPVGPEYYGVRVGPIRSGERIIGFTMITSDISDRKKAQLRLEQSNRELESFASVASHDLQEPLRKIQTFGERLKSTSAALSPEGRDYLERMQHAATRMRRLIDDLLSFSRVTSKAKPFANVDLSEIAREVLEDLETSVQQAGAIVTVGPLPTLEADPTQMRQLLQNLLSNALKFSREGVAPSITLRSTGPEGARSCVLEVEDNGIGFEEKYLDRIFDVFQRLHGRGMYEGTGIGLAICRKITERHGGSIGARSSPGKGATFTVTLPRRQSIPSS